MTSKLIQPFCYLKLCPKKSQYIFDLNQYDVNCMEGDHYKAKNAVNKKNNASMFSYMMKIASKAQEIHCSLSETFKQRTVVKSISHLNGKSREEIFEEDSLTVARSNANAYTYRTGALKARRNAICDEIDKCIVQTGGKLRSMRGDLIVDVNLSNWNLI